MNTATLTRSPAELRTPAPRSAAAPLPAPVGWLERLAAWAERQPRHRRLGSWTAVR